MACSLQFDERMAIALRGRLVSSNYTTWDSCIDYMGKPHLRTSNSGAFLHSEELDNPIVPDAEPRKKYIPSVARAASFPGVLPEFQLILHY